MRSSIRLKFMLTTTLVSITYLLQAQSELEKLWQVKNTKPKYSKEYVEALADIADYYSKREILDSAFHYYYLAIPLADSLNYLQVKHQLYTGLANSLLTKKEYEKALSYYQKCLQYYQEQKDTNHLITTYNNIALVHKNQQKYQEAKANYEKSLELLQKIPKNERWYEQSIMLENNLANIYALTGDVETSVRMIEKTLQYFDKFNNPIFQAGTYLNLADRYIVLNRLTEAENLLQKAIEIGKNIQALEVVRHGYQLLSNAYEKRKDFLNAFLYYKQYDSIDKKILNETNLKQINDLEHKYEMAKKDQEILRKEKALEKANYEKNRNYLILALLSSLLIAAGIGIRNLYLRNKRQQAEKKVVIYELEQALIMQEELKSQQEILKAQIEYQQKELISATLEKAQHHEAIMQIKEYVKKNTEKTKENIHKIKHLIASTENLEKDWQEFKLRFEKIHENFFKHLQDKYPDLTEHDLRICAFIKLHMDKKQIATLLNITPKAVEMNRYRLKKKFGLTPDEDLNKFIQDFE
ncbi:MAG: tetratricopeptide repeat protein [Raineya sp.]|nr:tetratricopeptide repeat protein [Raineya sp.]